MQNKTCMMCNRELPVDMFYKRENGYLRCNCKECYSSKSRKYYANHTEEYREAHSKYYKENKEKVGAYNRAQYKDRLKNDTLFKLQHNLRVRLRSAIKKNTKKGSAVKDLGCSIEEFKRYIEAQFAEGMSWDNWGINSWHIDHIVPMSAFDLSCEEQLKQAVHYSNLRPMWAEENRKKSSKIEVTK